MHIEEQSIRQYISMSTSTEIKKINIEDTDENFFKSHIFSTGGIRALNKHGFGYINDVTINIIITSLLKLVRNNSKKVFIGFDGRKDSSFFAFIAANIFRKYEYKVFMHDEPVITPFASFMAKEIGISIMITASHNDKNYNGIKIFLERGLQIAPNIGTICEHYIAKREFTLVDLSPYEYKVNTNTIVDLKKISFIEDFDFNDYLDKYCKDFNKRWQVETNTIHFTKEKILFSPLHGPGKIFMEHMAKVNSCLENIEFYEPHCIIDENFGTLEYPNPEHIEVFDDPITYADKNGIKMIMITDPDGDRLRLAFKKDYDFVDKTGNAKTTKCNCGDDNNWYFCDADEMALIISNYIFTSFSNQQTLIHFFNTFYCSDLLKKICFVNNIRHTVSDTGFRNISSNVDEARKNGQIFIFAYEDSYGFLLGDSPEKDGIACCITLMKILLNHESSIHESLCLVNKSYGLYYSDKKQYRVENPHNVLSKWIKYLEEKYEVYKMHKTYEVRGLDFKVFLRVSGTEPIIKMYAGSKGISKAELVNKFKIFCDEITSVKF